MNPRDFKQLRMGERRAVLDWSGNDALIVLIKDGDAIDSRDPQHLRAAIEVLEFDEAADPDGIVTARLRVRNTGDTRWLALPSSTLNGALDYDAAFLDKVIVPGTFVNQTPVARYRAYIEGNSLQGMVTLGARLWDVKAHIPIDLDYARGFLREDVAPGGAADVTMTLRAPTTPGLYCVTFDAVDEYLTWFTSEGSPIAVDYLTVNGAGAPPDSRAPRRLHATLALVDQPQSGLLVISLENTGDTVWLAGHLRNGGWIQVGVQRLDAAGNVVDPNWRRFPLQRSVLPGETARMRLDLASLTTEAIPAVRIDLVSEYRFWFGDFGTTPLTVVF
jgi:hypothetical protein